MFIGYARVSTLGQKDTSIEVQLQYLKLQAERLGYEFRGCYEKASGKSVEGRAVLSSILPTLKEGDILGVYDNSRLGRNTEENLAIIRNLNERGISVQINGKIVDINNPQDKLLFSVESAVSTYQRESQLLKSKAGTLQKKKNGDMVFAGDMIGWDIVKTKGVTKATIKEEDAKYIRFIFEEYAKGRSFRSIAEEFNNFVDCRFKVDTTYVSRVICKPLYMGYYPMESIGRSTRLDFTKEQFKANLIKSNVYPPIVREDLWWKVYDKYRETHKENPRNFQSRESNYELTSILTCPYCGTHYNHDYSKWKTKKNGLQEAATYVNFGHKKDCSHPIYRTFRAKDLEYVMRAFFFLTMEYPGEIDAFFKDQRVMLDQSTEALENQMKVVEKEISAIEIKINRLVDAVAEGLLDVGMIKSKLAGLKEEKSKKESDLAAIKNELIINQGKLDDILQEVTENKIEEFIHGNARTRRSIYMHYITKADMYDDYLSVEFFNGKSFVIEFYKKRMRTNISMPFHMFYNRELQLEGILDPYKCEMSFNLKEPKDEFEEFVYKQDKLIEKHVNENCLRCN